MKPAPMNFSGNLTCLTYSGRSRRYFARLRQIIRPVPGLSLETANKTARPHCARGRPVPDLSGLDVLQKNCGEGDRNAEPGYSLDGRGMPLSGIKAGGWRTRIRRVQRNRGETKIDLSLRPRTTPLSAGPSPRDPRTSLLFTVPCARTSLPLPPSSRPAPVFRYSSKSQTRSMCQ